MSSLFAQALYEYPIKSCAAREVRSLDLDAIGPVGDRRWMVVDVAMRFVTQRRDPALARVFCTPDGRGGLRVTGHGAPPLDIPAPPPDAPSREVVVWSDTVTARDAGDAAADWFSAIVGRPVRLVRIAPDAERRLDTSYAEGLVAFADGFPLLVMSAATLDALRARGHAIDARRFRPNVVIGGAAPFDEDAWTSLRIGGIDIDLVKPCSRCTMVDVDPDAGTPARGLLADLATFRRRDGQVFIGQNGVHRAAGSIRVGDPVTVRSAVATPSPYEAAGEGVQ